MDFYVFVCRGGLLESEASEVMAVIKGVILIGKEDKVALGVECRRYPLSI